MDLGVICLPVLTEFTKHVKSHRDCRLRIVDKNRWENFNFKGQIAEGDVLRSQKE